MKKKILSIVLVLCMVLSFVPATVFAEDCQHTDIDEYQVCTNCNTPVCPACHSSKAVVLATYNPATCEKEGTWLVFCVSSTCPAEGAIKEQPIEGTVPALGHKDENKDHNCDHNCGKSDMGDHTDMNGDHKCDYGCSVPICNHEELDASRFCTTCGYPICNECNKPFSNWVINEYPTCESGGMYTAVDNCGVFTADLLSLGHLDENNDHICDREECKKEGICLHKGTVNAYRNCDYCGLPVCPKCESSRYIEAIITVEGELVISYNAVQATCEEDGSWELTCLSPSCIDAGSTFSGTVPALGHNDESPKDHNCDICGKTLSEHSGGKADCTSKAICDDCGEEYGEVDPNNHTGSKAWEQNESQHKQYWECCDAVAVDYQDHTWSDGVCSECDYTCAHKDDNKDHLCDICGKTLSEHSGGKATCISKAVCEYCGEEYGEVNGTNHNLEKIPAKAATVTETGNKEYWHCSDCGKYFADEKGTSEIKLDDTVTQKLSPEIIGGKGQSITEGEKKELTFKSNAAFGDFIRAQLDGTTLDKRNYTVKEGSTVVTLKAEFVGSLSVGEHKIGIVSESGTAEATFTVNAKPAESPQTGDISHMAFWTLLLIVSGGAVVGTAAINKKKKHRKS